MKRQLFSVLLLAVVTAAATWWIGWWAAPVCGAAWGAARFGDYPAWTAAVGAALGWMLLLAYEALLGSMGEVSRLVGSTLGVPGWVPLAAAAAFPAALAAAGAGVSRGLMPLLEGAPAAAPAEPPPAENEDAPA